MTRVMDRLRAVLRTPDPQHEPDAPCPRCDGKGRTGPDNPPWSLYRDAVRG